MKYKSDRRINYERHMSLSTSDSLLNHPLEHRRITDNSSMIWVSCGIRPANMSKGAWIKAILFLYFHDWTSRCKCMFFVHSQESERLMEYVRNWHYWQPRFRKKKGLSDYLEWFHDNLQFIVMSPCMAFRPAPLDQDRYEKVSILCNLRICTFSLQKGLWHPRMLFLWQDFVRKVYTNTQFLDYLCFYLLSTSEKNG